MTSQACLPSEETGRSAWVKELFAGPELPRCLADLGIHVLTYRELSAR